MIVDNYTLLIDKVHQFTFDEIVKHGVVNIELLSWCTDIQDKFVLETTNVSELKTMLTGLMANNAVYHSVLDLTGKLKMWIALNNVGGDWDKVCLKIGSSLNVLTDSTDKYLLDGEKERMGNLIISNLSDRDTSVLISTEKWITYLLNTPILLYIVLLIKAPSVQTKTVLKLLASMGVDINNE